MPDDRRSIIKVSAFISPEDLGRASTYLLFSRERTHEKEYAHAIEQAFLNAELTPLRLFVQRDLAFLECRCYVESLSYDKYVSPADNFFTRAFSDAIVHIPTARIRSKINGRNANNYTYNFAQTNSE